MPTVPKIAIVIYSTYGHIVAMAQEIKKGMEEAGAQVQLFRVPETLPTEVLEKLGAVEAQKAFANIPIIDFSNQNLLADVDAIAFGFPTRFGNMPAQMKAFVDGLGQMWFQGKLIGKATTIFTSTSSQHMGAESTILSSLPPLMHLGMIYVPVPLIPEMTQIEEVAGGSAYGASTITGPAGARMPSDKEKAIARKQGAYLSTIAAKLATK